MTTRQAAMRTGRRGGSGVGAFLLGFVLALVAVVGGGWLYLRFGHPPVAVADKPLPFEQKIADVALHARVAREMGQPPYGVSEDVYEGGAHAYVNHCAGCHGLSGTPAGLGRQMFPHAPQLWQKHAHGGVVGVSDDEPGETYWKIDQGIRLSGMPAFHGKLSADDEWNIALLLKNADQPLPDPVMGILAGK